ncbi:hypothetical protein [Streptomyces sp. PT12]|uniref:hypothetical protein n=1 Tax=Streptomyces sp. PT12 TaxID=1510197 RepID=UPI0011BDCBB7|nr:hypothetical protein [Streptomyces sp. PT12]
MGDSTSRHAAFTVTAIGEHACLIQADTERAQAGRGGRRSTEPGQAQKQPLIVDRLNLLRAAVLTNGNRNDAPALLIPLGLT